MWSTIYIWLNIAGAWQNMESTLKEGSVNLTQITDDLIDQIWTTGRPAQPNSTINALPMEYAGDTSSFLSDNTSLVLFYH